MLYWKLDRLGRDLRHLVNTVHNLTVREVGLKVLTYHGAAIDTTTATGGKLVFGVFATLAEFEREMIKERTLAGVASARARGGVVANINLHAHLISHTIYKEALQIVTQPDISILLLF